MPSRPGFFPGEGEGDAVNSAPHERELFEAKPLSISGAFVLRKKSRADSRGSFVRAFSAEGLRPVGWERPVQQVNFSSTSKRGTIRGMHFQTAPDSEMKLVTCARGAIFDVIVDVRPESSTFGQWCSVELSDANDYSVVIPAGCAHGFQTLTDDVELVYVHDQGYSLSAESGVNPFDVALNISWPLAVTEVSPRDQNLPRLETFFLGE
jgi:dTDP-4-dehydrorhamnose 3,5-epimerase